ncbi:MAG: cardiolipin synthase [Thermoproteus sp. CIS_19]|jgi:Phosphatidylserine/phosphatidylglycerophosphate/cardiolipin synthases and related enzymes|nr:MAG: cardiolipin synthase [Thermoproteus sp. CIS_19]
MRTAVALLLLASMAAAQALNLCPNAVIVGPQNATAILTYISNAQKAVYIEAYALTWRELAQALASLAREGVQVYVVLSGNVYGGVPTTERQLVDYLKNNGVYVAYNYDFKYVHTKTFVVDNRTVIIGSINPTYSGVTSDIGLDVVVQNSTLAQEIATIILNDYRGVYPNYGYLGVVISPVNSYDYLSWLLQQRGKAYAAVEEIFASSGLADALTSKAELALARVTDVQGVQTVRDLTAKVIVVGDYVYVGSINLSGNSINNNRELGLLLRCPSLAAAAVRLIGQWAGATATSAAQPPSTTGAQAGAPQLSDVLILIVVILLALVMLSARGRRRKRRV